MNRHEKLILVKNAVANVLRGSAAALVAVILPPFLTRLMSVDAFGAWSLVLQISAYVGYLDFGIQTAIGRFVAHSNETGDEEHRDRIISTSLVGLTAAGILGIAGSLAAAVLLPHFFHQMPFALVADARVALVVVASSLAIGLPASVFNGIFVGLQRYEVPAITIGVSRVLSAVLLVFVARHGGDLTRMGLVMAAVNVGSYVLQFLMYRKMAPAMRLSPRLASSRAGRELFDYCLSLTIWSFAMLLVTGLDLLIVGYFQFEAVAYYAVAATLITFLVGLQQAVFNVMIPSTAVQHARGNSKELGSLMLTATRYGSFLLLLTGLPLVLAAKSILGLWVGSSYAVRGASILQVLVIANIIRLSAVPYVMTLIGTGQQRLVLVTPLLEGFSNLLGSIIGGYFLGALGVAIGTLLGSLIGVMGNFLYNMPRTAGLEFTVSRYLRDGLWRPFFCATPLVVAVVLFRNNADATAITRYGGLVVAFFATVFVVWRWGLIGSERQKLRLLGLAAQTQI
jgi:O-antigen/teichoic acid export membrane protein